MKVRIFILSFLLISSSGVFASISGMTPGKKAEPISEQLLRTFKSTFPNAREVRWAASTDYYTVNFSESEISVKIVYDKQGNFVSAFRYYLESKLPVSILCKLQKQYAGRKVFGVTEVTAETQVLYFVKLEGPSTWTTVRSDVSGNMETVEELNKAE